MISYIYSSIWIIEPINIFFQSFTRYWIPYLDSFQEWSFPFLSSSRRTGFRTRAAIFIVDSHWSGYVSLDCLYCTRWCYLDFVRMLHTADWLALHSCQTGSSHTHCYSVNRRSSTLDFPTMIHSIFQCL